MKKTGICASSGRQDAKGLTLCSWYSFIISSLSFWRSPRCCCCSRFISGCNRCISSMPLVLFSVSGVRIAITTTVIIAMAMA